MGKGTASAGCRCCGAACGGGGLSGVPFLGKADLMALYHEIPGAEVSELGKLTRGGGGGGRPKGGLVLGRGKCIWLFLGTLGTHQTRETCSSQPGTWKFHL